MNKRSQGFTIIEITVALAIFATVTLIAVGALVRIIAANQKSQTLQLAVNNIQFVLEAMSRELRVGSNFHCHDDPMSVDFNPAPSQCIIAGAPSGAVIGFTSSEPDPALPTCRLVFAYSFRPNPANTAQFLVEKGKQAHCGENLSFVSLIPPDVSITGYRLGVAYDSVNQPYPLAFIRIIGSVGDREVEKTEFDVQASVSQRILE